MPILQITRCCVSPSKAVGSVQEFWARLEHLKIGHTAVADDLQAAARKMLAGLASNVASANLVTLDDLLPSGLTGPRGPAEGALHWWAGLMQDQF